MNRPVRDITKELRKKLDTFLPDLTTNKTNVLYIDDEALNITSFKAIFRRSNFNVITANTLEEGFKVLSTNKVDILLTDYEMPIHNGHHVLSTVLAMYPNITPIVLSGYFTPDNMYKLKESFNGITLVEKPFNSDVLEKLINTLSPTYH